MNLPTENQVEHRAAELRARRLKPKVWSGQFRLSREDVERRTGSSLPTDLADPPSEQKRQAGSKGGRVSAARRWNA